MPEVDVKQQKKTTVEEVVESAPTPTVVEEDTLSASSLSDDLEDDTERDRLAADARLSKAGQDLAQGVFQFTEDISIHSSFKNMKGQLEAKLRPSLTRFAAAAVGTEVEQSATRVAQLLPGRIAQIPGVVEAPKEFLTGKTKARDRAAKMTPGGTGRLAKLREKLSQGKGQRLQSTASTTQSSGDELIPGYNAKLRSAVPTFKDLENDWFNIDEKLHDLGLRGLNQSLDALHESIAETLKDPRIELVLSQQSVPDKVTDVPETTTT